VLDLTLERAVVSNPSVKSRSQTNLDDLLTYLQIVDKVRRWDF
jgi:hypothetical protein